MPYLCVIGLVKNQKLPANILTPTTKAEDHDVPVAPDEVLAYISDSLYKNCENSGIETPFQAKWLDLLGLLPSTQ